MKDGMVVMNDRGEFLSRKGKGVRMDENGMIWSTDIQKARVWGVADAALKVSAQVGGKAVLMRYIMGGKGT